MNVFAELFIRTQETKVTCRSSTTSNFQPRQRRRGGLSLAEVLIAGSIAAMLLLAIAAAYDAMAQSVEVNDRFNRAAQIARISVRKMVEEVRTAEACQVGTSDQQTQSSIVNAPNLDVIRGDGKVVHYVFDADEKQVACAVIFFDDFGRQARQCPIDARAIHDAGFLYEIHVCWGILP